jgi:hypothetical protein
MDFLMLMIPAVYQPGNEDNDVVRTGAPDPESVARMMKFNEELHAAGALIALNGLMPPSEGAKVSYRGGKPVVTDGPFAEAKEVIGGYWIIRAASKAEALDWARRIPAGEDDIVQVRPIMNAADFPEPVIEAARESAPNVTAEMTAGR